MSRTYTVTLEIEVTMTHKGYRMRQPDMNQPGEPAEPPEFEIESVLIEGTKKNLTDSAVLPAIYDYVLDLAHEDDWSEEYDY